MLRKLLLKVILQSRVFFVVMQINTGQHILLLSGYLQLGILQTLKFNMFRIETILFHF